MNDTGIPNETATTQRELWKVLVAAFIGTVIEWYDFFLYGTAAALEFDKLFFPTITPWAGKMAAFGTYAVGFFARPLGGVVFGYIGDRYGRKVALVWTLSLMGVTTFLVGCLPTYDTAGIWAPILLVVLRLAQGVAVGGEWGGAALLTIEHGHKSHRGFYGSWTQAGVPMGLLLANAVYRGALSIPGISWGWRIPFWFGIVLTVVGFLIRHHIKESPLFTKVKSSEANEKPKNPLLQVIRKNWKSILTVIGARIAENASFYVFSVFILSYTTAQLGLPKGAALNGVLWGSGFELFAIPFFGIMSDRIGRRGICLFGTLGLIAFAFPFFWMIETKDATIISLALGIALAVVHAPMYAPQAAFFSELFGTNVRFSGVSLGYQLSSPLAGGLALLIAEYLVKMAHGRSWGVSMYLITIGTISTLSIYFSRETNKTDIAAEVDG